jgi:hypothetical protein
MIGGIMECPDCKYVAICKVERGSINCKFPKEKKGGKRDGAGRPTLPLDKKKKGFMVYWTPDLIGELDAMEGSRSVILEEAFRRLTPQNKR